jgi:hypothetical protein
MAAASHTSVPLAECSNRIMAGYLYWDGNVAFVDFLCEGAVNQYQFFPQHLYLGLGRNAAILARCASEESPQVVARPSLARRVSVLAWTAFPNIAIETFAWLNPFAHFPVHQDLL